MALLDTSDGERKSVAGAVTRPHGHLTVGRRVVVELAAAGPVRRRTLGATELVRVPELERERAGVVDRQPLLQQELRGDAGGAVVRLVVQVGVVVDLDAVHQHLDLAVRAQRVQRRQRRQVGERQVRVLGHRARVAVLDGQRLVLARQHVAPGEGRVVDRGAAAGGDLDLADRSRHAAGLGVLQVRAGVTDGVEDQCERGHDGRDAHGDARVDASDGSGHLSLNSSDHALD